MSFKKQLYQNYVCTRSIDEIIGCSLGATLLRDAVLIVVVQTDVLSPVEVSLNTYIRLSSHIRMYV